MYKKRKGIKWREFLFPPYCISIIVTFRIFSKIGKRRNFHFSKYFHFQNSFYIYKNKIKWDGKKTKNCIARIVFLSPRLLGYFYIHIKIEKWRNRKLGEGEKKRRKENRKMNKRIFRPWYGKKEKRKKVRRVRKFRKKKKRKKFLWDRLCCSPLKFSCIYS